MILSHMAWRLLVKRATYCFISNRLSAVVSNTLRLFVVQPDLLQLQHNIQLLGTASASTSAVFESLRNVLGETKVSSGEAVKEQHSHDESHHRSNAPDIVVFPECTADVSAIAKICSSNGVPMIPYGTGTGMEGGVVSTHGGVSIDMSMMKSISGYYPEDFNVTVQPGVTRLTLNEYLKGDGLWFPVDPGADASLCGMAATSASGTCAVKYGTMKDNVVNLEVVLADGTVINTAGKDRRTRKTAAGYNLTNLFVGSEGTLGFITSTTLRLYGIPESTAAAVCHFDTIKAAVDAVQDVLQSGIQIARIELLDGAMMKAVNKYSKLSYKETPSLFLEFHGTEQSTKEQAESVGDICKEYGTSGFLWAQDHTERNKLWKARHDVLYACLSYREPGCVQISTDVCVPLSNLTEIITATQKDIAETGMFAPILGHVGDGNFHIPVVYDPKNKKEVEKMEIICKKVVQRALALNGTCTGEHGVGIGKRKYLEEELGKSTVNVMKMIKAALDPHGLMNPGKVLPD